jgi:uncharacterized protein (TIGR02118 family)
MLKLNICAARRPGMTHAAYSRYARDNHARLVLGTEPVSRYLAAYIQQHVYDGCYGPDAPTMRYDSVSHIFSASLADQKAATETPEYKNIIAPDEPNFADTRSAMFLMFEEQPLPLPVRGASSYRLLHYLQNKPGVSAAELHTAWAAAHEALLSEAPALFSGVRRAVLNTPAAIPGAPQPQYAGMCELGFLQQSDDVAMGEYTQLIETRLEPLIQRSASFYLLAEAVPVRGTLY